MAKHKSKSTENKANPLPRPKPKGRPLDKKTQATLDAHEELMTLPVQHAHAAGIDVGDQTHWVCVAPNSEQACREFPAHTPGLRELSAWLKQCGVTTVALEASGVYGHVLFLTLLEAGFQVIMTAPHFT